MGKTDQMQRTKTFALRAVRLAENLPHSVAGEVFGKQLLRCATSVAANYRAACRGKSEQDFLAKLKICEEEADESVFWMEMIVESGMIPEAKMADLLGEARQLSAIITAACKTTAAKLRNTPAKPRGGAARTS